MFRRQMGSNGSNLEGHNISNERSQSFCQYGDDNSVFLDLPKDRYMSAGRKNHKCVVLTW